MSNLIPSGTIPPEEFDFVRWNPKTETPAGSFTPANRCDIILNQNPLDIQPVAGIPPALAAAKWNAFVDYLNKWPKLRNLLKKTPSTDFLNPLNDAARTYRNILLEAIILFNGTNPTEGEERDGIIYPVSIPPEELKLYRKDIPLVYIDPITKESINNEISGILDTQAAQIFNKKTDPKVIVLINERFAVKSTDRTISGERVTGAGGFNPNPQLQCLKYPEPIIRPFYKEIEKPPPPINYQGEFERYKRNPFESIGETYRIKINNQQQQIVNKEQFEEIKKQFLLKDLDKESFFDRIKNNSSSNRDNIVDSLKNDSFGEWVPIMKEWGIINPDGSYNYSVVLKEFTGKLIYYYPKGMLPIAQEIAKENGDTDVGFEPFPPETVIPVVWGNKRFIISQDDYSANYGGIIELNPDSPNGNNSRGWWRPATYFKSYDLEVDLYKDKLPWVTLNKEYLTSFTPFPEWVDAGRSEYVPKIDPTKIDDATKDYYDDIIGRLSDETKLLKGILK